MAEEGGKDARRKEREDVDRRGSREEVGKRFTTVFGGFLF